VQSYRSHRAVAKLLILKGYTMACLKRRLHYVSRPTGNFLCFIDDNLAA